MAKQEIEMHGLEVDEMDFGSIGKTLGKYGKGVPADEPKKAKRSSVHTDYTMTGHKEGKSSTGRVYTKAPEMDREPEAIKATAKTDQVEAPKRGRGRPAGAANKAGTGKGWSAEAKASMKAKLAARKAAKLAAAKNESEDCADIVEATDRPSTRHYLVGLIGQNLTGHTSKSSFASEKDAKEYQKEFKHVPAIKHARIVKGTSDMHGFITPVTESTKLTEEDWADIVEGQSLDSIVEFMMDEEYQSLDELSKKTLGSYIKKAAGSSTANATAAMHGKNREAEARADAEYYRKAKEPENAKRKEAYADVQHKASYNATETSIKRLKGVAKATDRLTKESVEIDEASHGGDFKEGDIVRVEYHDISGKTRHGTANVDKATKAFVHVKHPTVPGLTVKFHQTINGKNSANEVGTLPGSRAGGHKIIKKYEPNNESTEDLNIQRYAALIGKNLIKE